METKRNNALEVSTISTVKMDEGVTKNDLLTLGKQLSNLSSGNVRTLTVPLATANGRHPTVGSVVIWDEVLAPELWNRIKTDAPLVDTVLPTTDPAASASSKPSSKATPGATPGPTTIDKFKTQTAASNPCASKK
jgi:hypothetical protein